MEQILSKIQVNTAPFKDRSDAYKNSVSDLKNRIRKVATQRNPDVISKHLERKKMLARDRINLLLDEDTPFLELSPLAAINRYADEFPSAGMITGIGTIRGKESVIIANDATVKGGTYIPETIKKHLRAQEIAMENFLPVVYLVDSGGIFLPKQSEVFADKNDFGRIFFNMAKMSSMGIPQISLVMGSCTAGGAYIPAMSDQVIMVKNQGTVFLGGPPLVKAATGEKVSAEDLGGAVVHTALSGVGDYLANSDEHALYICRELFGAIQQIKQQKLEMEEISEPAYDPSELYGILPFSARENVDPREIIARIVDGSRFSEFKANYATTLVTGFSRIMGFPVGIVANYGILYSESALKATHFIELCNQRKTPLLFLQNITGFMVGRDAENKGIAKDGAKMVHAVSTAVVPKFTIIFGGSYGAGNYAMAGRAYEPRLLFMYPNSTISVMGGEQAANVLLTVKEEQYASSGRTIPQVEAQKLRENITKKYAEEGSAYYSTSALWDDGIIDPADTRKMIAMGISVSLNRKFEGPGPGIFRM